MVRPFSARSSTMRSRYTGSDSYTINDRSDTGCCEAMMVFLSILLLILTVPFSLCFSFRVVSAYEKGVVFRLGRVMRKLKGPGMVFLLPCTDHMIKIDLRTVSFDVPPQEALTKDHVTIAVDACTYYKVHDPFLSVIKVVDFHDATRLLSMTTLRNVLGVKNLADILSDREGICASVRQILDIATDDWGITVERVEIKDVVLPPQLQKAMAAEAEASREARAKVVAAEGEMKAARALKEASDVINRSPGALQLRYLQTLRNISSDRPSTIIYPVPLDFLTPFTNK